MYGYSCHIKQNEFNKIEALALEVRLDYCLFDDYIDIFDFLTKRFNAKLYNYSSLAKQTKQLSFDCSDKGFTALEELSGGIIIPHVYYNDGFPYETQRFTLAHELKHIIFNEYETDEHSECLAEYFAKNFLDPKVIALNSTNLEPNAIRSQFGIPLESSYYLINGIINRKNKYGNDIFEYEKEFYDLYLKNKR